MAQRKKTSPGKQPAEAKKRPAEAGQWPGLLEAEPFDIPREDRLKLYWNLKHGRAVEDRIFILYRQGRLAGSVYLGRGQEAITVGATYALEAADTIAPTHRDLIAQLTKGLTAKQAFLNHFGRASAPTAGRDGNTHCGDMSLGILYNVSMLPDGYPLTAGIAFSFKLRNEPRVAMAFCGEGATARGDWHEALNFAAVFQVPAVFVVENNKYAYSTPTVREMRIENVADRAPGYGIPGYVIDGNDVEEVYRSAKEAVDRARSGGGPSLIEAKTMRMLGHAGHDPFKYVPKELLEEWEKRDPVMLYEQKLLKEGVIDKTHVEQTDEEMKRIVDEALEFAENSPLPDPEEVATGVYHGE